MTFTPFWLTRFTFANMNPFTGFDAFLLHNLFWLAVGAGLRLLISRKLPARIVGLVLALGWVILAIIADFAVRTEIGYPLTELSVTWGPRFLMATLGFLLSCLVCRLLKKRLLT